MIEEIERLSHAFDVLRENLYKEFPLLKIVFIIFKFFDKK